ncbi:uncharacterized protein LOC143606023 [Bidens hawaiensis]|uniref:uncharacterized protein LOC143606023 n=1 Tax=Bidens hawaiensis TaxID=980011 RepID=UPI0040496A9B
MALVLRYVDKLGLVKERFISLVHVKDTTNLSLKHAIVEVFARNNLSLTKVRGQGYDGASNMSVYLGITNNLSQSLQRKDQDIVNAMDMVKATKQELQAYRLNEFDSLLKEVTYFCEENEIEVVDMDDQYVDPKYRRKKTGITNRHYYEFENFKMVLDMQIQELGNRYKVTTELLMCMGSLSPDGNFSAFNEDKMLRLAEMYPNDFSYEQRESLKHELCI